MKNNNKNELKRLQKLEQDLINSLPSTDKIREKYYIDIKGQNQKNFY